MPTFALTDAVVLVLIPPRFLQKSGGHNEVRGAEKLQTFEQLLLLLVVEAEQAFPLRRHGLRFVDQTVVPVVVIVGVIDVTRIRIVVVEVHCIVVVVRRTFGRVPRHGFQHAAVVSVKVVVVHRR